MSIQSPLVSLSSREHPWAPQEPRPEPRGDEGTEEGGEADSDPGRLPPKEEEESYVRLGTDESSLSSLKREEGAEKSRLVRGRNSQVRFCASMAGWSFEECSCWCPTENIVDS